MFPTLYRNHDLNSFFPDGDFFKNMPKKFLGHNPHLLEESHSDSLSSLTLFFSLNCDIFRGGSRRTPLSDPSLGSQCGSTQKRNKYHRGLFDSLLRTSPQN